MIQDYGFRLYNPSIGKFLSVDPLSWKYVDWSPYVFAGNNPIKFEDVLGLGPGDKCEGCPDPNKSIKGDTYTDDDNEFYSIKYELFEDDDKGNRYWDIVDSEIEDLNQTGMSPEQASGTYQEYLDKTGYIKVGNPFTSYEIDASNPSVGGLIYTLLSPFETGTTLKGTADKDGFIHVSKLTSVTKMGIGQLPKALNRMSQVVRDMRYFKNGSPLQKMLANYWKKGAQIGNGGSAAALLDEFNTGRKLKHLDKVLGYRKSFLSALKGRPNSAGVSYGKLTKVQSEIVVRELIEIQKALSKVLTK